MAAAAGVPARTGRGPHRHPAADRQGDAADGEATPMTHGAVVVHDDDPLARVSALVRAVPDFPEPGVVFRDITPVLADGQAFTAVALGSRRCPVRQTSSSASRRAGSCSALPRR